jgi:2-polyprenyl-3-methyl-5-hydroxy-6-metoxy-1,4-benzoquinol methylase
MGLVASAADAMLSIGERVYSNQGNVPLIALIDPNSIDILDIGCGAGDNALLLRQRYPRSRVFGITQSTLEAKYASRHMEHCWTFDLEGDFPDTLISLRFDTLLLSHVLEHLRDPAAILARVSPLLRPGGSALIAVPNVLTWRQRVDFLLGRFEYQTGGVLDDTHLRFFTYSTADRYLFSRSSDLKLEFKGVTGSVPLGWLRRHVLPQKWSETLDRWGCNHWPNLFGGQVLLKATKRRDGSD